MGQAKARGSREERIKQSIEREELRQEALRERKRLEAERERERVAALPEEEKIQELFSRRKSRMDRLQMASLLAMAAGMMTGTIGHRRDDLDDMKRFYGNP